MEMAEADDLSKQIPTRNAQSNQTEQRVDRSRRFLTFLKNKLKENDARYDEFLRVMAQFKEHRYFPPRIDIEGVCKKVQDLFKANKQILVEFNRLIPSDYRIQVQPVSAMQGNAYYEDATQYSRRVKVGR